MHRPVERAGHALARTALGGGEAGVRPGRQDDSGAAARCHAAALETQVRLVERPAPGLGRVHGILRHRRRLARQRRLVHGEGVRAQDPHIGGDQITGAETHHIAGHQLVDRDLP